jgi:kumamolisin
MPGQVTVRRRVSRKVELSGSERPGPEADVIGGVAADQPISVAIHFKRRRDHVPAGSAEDLARLAQPMTRAELDKERARTHARAAARILDFAKGNGLTVQDVDLTRRRVVVEAPAERMAAIFGARMCLYSDGKRTFRGRHGVLQIPREIAPWVRAILGFDERAQARYAAENGGAGSGLWPTEIASLYGIPLDQDISGVCVGIIALGGGYQRSDLEAAMKGMRRPIAEIAEESVLGVTNSFGNDPTSDEELALDLQIIASLVPTARIAVYFAQHNTRSLAEAIQQAVLDEKNRPQVLSISWGSAENYWTDPAISVLQAALADAMRRQISVVVAAGDELATSAVPDGKAHVWFPASSPYVLGCGGTAIQMQNGRISAETVWNEGVIGTGGGVSDKFGIPDYQSQIVVPASVSTGKRGRGVPDTAAAAANNPGYRIILGGESIVKNGTSAAAPLWASLIAMINAQRGAPIGFLNPQLYALPDLLRLVTQGDNEVNGIGYKAGNGWSACTGLGVPKGAEIIAKLGERLLS